MGLKERCNAIYTNFRDRLPDLLSALCCTSEKDTETFKKLENELQFILLSVARADIWKTWSKEDCVKILQAGWKVLSLHSPSETTAYYSCLQDFLEYLMLHHQIEDECIGFGVWYGGMVSDLFYASRVGGEDKSGHYFEISIARLSSSCLRDWKTYLKMLDTAQAFRLNELIGEVLNLSKSKGWAIGSYTEEYLRNLSTGCVSKLTRKGNMKTKRKQSKYLEMVKLLSDAITDKGLNDQQHTRLSKLFRLICTTSLPHRWRKEKRETVVQLLTRNVELGVFGETDKAIVGTLRALKKLLPHSGVKKKTYGGAAIGLAGVGTVACGGYRVVSKSPEKTQEKEKESVVSSKSESQSEQKVEGFPTKIRKLLPWLNALMVKLDESILPSLKMIEKACEEVCHFYCKGFNYLEIDELEVTLYHLVAKCRDQFSPKVFSEQVVMVLETYQALVVQIENNVPEKKYDPNMAARTRLVERWYNELLDELDDDSEDEPEDNKGYIKMNTTKSKQSVNGCYSSYFYVFDAEEIISYYEVFLAATFSEENVRVCENKKKRGEEMRSILKDIQLYASLVPLVVLRRMNVFSKTPCPLPHDPHHLDSYGVCDGVFDEIRRIEDILFTQKNLSGERKAQLINKLKISSENMIAFLRWFKGHLLTIVKALHEE